MEIQAEATTSSPLAGSPLLFNLLCLAASVVILLPLEAVERALGSSSRLAWCALFWVSTLSLPVVPGTRGRWSVGLGISLCVLGLAAHLDLSRGGDVTEVWATAWPTVLFSVLLAGAASKARQARSTTRYLLLWFLFVPGAPLLSHSLGHWGGASIPGWLDFIASASPLDWLAGRVGVGGTEPWLPLGVAVLLFSSAAVSAGSGEEVKA